MRREIEPNYLKDETVEDMEKSKCLAPVCQDPKYSGAVLYQLYDPLGAESFYLSRNADLISTEQEVSGLFHCCRGDCQTGAPLCWISR